MNERRKSRRNRTLRSAKICFNGLNSDVDCTVRDLSDDGARLTLTSTIGVPDGFQLDLLGSKRPCRVAWRSAVQLGVALEQPL